MGNIADISKYPIRQKADIKNQDALVGWDYITEEQFNYQVDDIRSFYNAKSQALLIAYDGTNDVAFFQDNFYYWDEQATTGGFPATGKGGGRWMSIEDQSEQFAIQAESARNQAVFAQGESEAAAAASLGFSNTAAQQAGIATVQATQSKEARDEVFQFFQIDELSDSETIDPSMKLRVQVNKAYNLVEIDIVEGLDFVEGDVISFETWIEDGIIRFLPQANVTLNYDTVPVVLAEQGYLRYIGNDNWLLFGNI